MQNRGQGDAQRWHRFKISKAQSFAAKIIDCYSLVFIADRDNRLLDPSVLSPDVHVCFRTPGTPPCRCLHVKKPMTQLSHHTLAFNDVYTSQCEAKLITISGKRFYLQISTRKEHTFKNISALSPLQRNGFENPIH